jgi:DNA-binding transcriptional MerR regulator
MDPTRLRLSQRSNPWSFSEQTLATAPRKNDLVMRIGELAAATGEAVKMLRFWEEQGLLEAERSESGYRYFVGKMPERARFIRQAQALGFTLNEIRGILDLRDDGLQPCDDVRARLEAHLEVIRERQRKLKALERELEARLRWAEADAEPLCEDGCVYLASKTLDN